MNDSHSALRRRGFNLGSVDLDLINEPKSKELPRWAKGKAILLSGICNQALDLHQDNLRQSEILYAAILDEQSCDDLLSKTPYVQHIETQFECLGCSVNTGDDQEIETVLFDTLELDPARDGEPLAQDLWLKVSWLSFYEEDASMRFRFSFGVDHQEDVAADHVRQHYAAQLTDAVFPESRIITQNQQLNTQLLALLDCDRVQFVERIIYFNSPSGGAYLHHDRERGHAGVVYAQLSGTTFWLALPKHTLVDEISNFISGFIEQGDSIKDWPSTLTPAMQEELIKLNAQSGAIAEQLDSFANSSLIHLINETMSFVQHLVTRGHGYVVREGDALLLPQETDQDCCWHSVFTIGDEPGQALSFAIKRST